MGRCGANCMPTRRWARGDRTMTHWQPKLKRSDINRDDLAWLSLVRWQARVSLRIGHRRRFKAEPDGSPARRQDPKWEI